MKTDVNKLVTGAIGLAVSLAVVYGIAWSVGRGLDRGKGGKDLV